MMAVLARRKRRIVLAALIVLSPLLFFVVPQAQCDIQADSGDPGEDTTYWVALSRGVSCVFRSDCSNIFLGSTG